MNKRYICGEFQPQFLYLFSNLLRIIECYNNKRNTKVGAKIRGKFKCYWLVVAFMFMHLWKILMLNMYEAVYDMMQKCIKYLK